MGASQPPVRVLAPRPFGLRTTPGSVPLPDRPSRTLRPPRATRSRESWSARTTMPVSRPRRRQADSGTNTPSGHSLDSLAVQRVGMSPRIARSASATMGLSPGGSAISRPTLVALQLPRRSAGGAIARAQLPRGALPRVFGRAVRAVSLRNGAGSSAGADAGDGGSSGDRSTASGEGSSLSGRGRGGSGPKSQAGSATQKRQDGIGRPRWDNLTKRISRRSAAQGPDRFQGLGQCFGRALDPRSTLLAQGYEDVLRRVRPRKKEPVGAEPNRRTRTVRQPRIGARNLRRASARESSRRGAARARSERRAPCSQVPVDHRGRASGGRCHRGALFLERDAARARP